MYPEWSQTISLNDCIENWDYSLEPSGVYVISGNKPIDRAMGRDPFGILYIGKSKDLLSRISGLRTSNHNATWFLYNNRPLARFYINPDIKDDETKMSGYVGDLCVSLARANLQYKAEALERIALSSYVSMFGELPPLNNALPERWEHKIEPNDKEWFKRKFS